MATIIANGTVINHITLHPAAPTTPPPPQPVIAYVPFGAAIIAYLTGGLRVKGTVTDFDITNKSIILKEDGTGATKTIPTASSRVFINVMPGATVNVYENNHYYGPIHASGTVNVYERSRKLSFAAGPIQAYREIPGNPLK